MEFRKGNIVIDQWKNMMIVEGIRTVKSIDGDYQVIDWISFTSENCSGATRVGKYEMEEGCYCDAYTGEPDECCETCKGEGYYTKEYLGTDGWTKLADNCEHYIKKRLLKNFEF